MWSKLDDALLDHPKIFTAGKTVGGSNGPALALGFYTVLLMWSNRHLTNGFVPESTIGGFAHVRNPRAVADALARAGLLDRARGGFQIHDFNEYNPSPTKVKAHRRAARLRQQRHRERHGHGVTGNGRRPKTGES
jgi:hypothetical protein